MPVDGRANDEQDPVRSGKRLALFFDGTWNEPGDHTNVWRLYLMLADRGQDGMPQDRFYDEGVGTRWFDRISGGAFGAGVSENIRKGYRWLIEHYNPGDEIFIFGFSRGAFTARSLAGLIARCGLLRPDAPISFVQVFDRYKRGDAVPAIYELIREKRTPKDLDFEEKALLNHAYYHRDLIKMVGVWDTVGSIGVPFGTLKGVSRRTLSFHNTRLSKTIQHSYQALALDEQRKPYWGVLWTSFVPDQPDVTDRPEPDDRIVEQRWFSGAHANVGGGYRDDVLPERPLAWIQEKARSCGLAFRCQISVSDEDLQQLPRDSYVEFLCGLWKVVTGGKRFVRWVMSDPVHKDAKRTGKGMTHPGWVATVNERIDLSVFHRCQQQPAYRPLSLKEWAKRKHLDLEAIIASPENHPELWLPVTTAGVETEVARSGHRQRRT
jgi:uncharacterized protein (DUF2235 family)